MYQPWLRRGTPEQRYEDSITWLSSSLSFSSRALILVRIHVRTSELTVLALLSTLSNTRSTCKISGSNQTSMCLSVDPKFKIDICYL